MLLIKEFLRQHIGTTYATATQPSDANLLGVDMQEWAGCVGRVRVRHSTSYAGLTAGTVSMFAGSLQNCAHGTTGHRDIS